MGDLIQFPKKKDFLATLPADLPQNAVAALSSAWDRTAVLVTKSKGLTVSPEVHRYLVLLWSRILELETNAELMRRGL